MKIQLIQHKEDNTDRFSSVPVSTLNSPISPDEFNVDVIDLTAASLWRSQKSNFVCIDDQNDLNSLREMVERKSKAIIVYVLPRNLCCLYGLYTGKPTNSFQIKDNLPLICHNILSAVLPSRFCPFELVFERTKTIVDNTAYEAEFFFETGCNPVTISDQSKKITTIEIEAGSIYATTLQITESEELLERYINSVLVLKDKSPIPEWINTVYFFDDYNLIEGIANNQSIIENAEKQIADAKEALEKNSYYKSILYTNGDKLVKVVFEMLEKLLNYDLSDFVDKKNEDFLIKLNDVTFIGEIKGETSNVKNTNVSQVDNHYHGYIDNLPENSPIDGIHQLLIINPLRNTPIDDREPVNERQINLAIRNGCLIIETKTLLKIFERHLQGQITPEKCIEVFSTHTGLLNISDFD